MRTSSVLFNPMLRHFQEKIKFSGPITVAEYMKTCLYHPEHGFYNKNPLGRHGHFITSPEISSFFGEMLGIWAAKQWQSLGCPRPFSFIELGPGRGLMCSDILKTFMKITDVSPKELSVHLIENSSKLKALQEERMKALFKTGTDDGVSVTWSSNLLESRVTSPFVLFANEFFDALPIHIFKKDTTQWREVLVGLEESSDKFDLVRSRTSSASLKLIPECFQSSRHLELSFESGIILLEIVRMLQELKGSCLIIDYGEESMSGNTDTFRGYRSHKQVDPLSDPGECDLTADVNFAYFKTVLTDEKCSGVSSFGLIEQGDFLLQLGLMQRLDDEMSRCSSERKAKEIFSAFTKIVSPKEMGSRFKVMGIQNEDLPRPPGFDIIEDNE